MCRTLVRVVLVMVVVLGLAPRATPSARADAAGMVGDDGGSRPTSVEAALIGTNVRLTARFAIDVEGPGVNMDMRSFALPAHGVVTAGSVIVDGKRHRMRLEHAAKVERRFDALTLKPGGADRAWAFSLDGRSGLDVLAPRKARVIVELVLDVATCFYADARFVELPASWWERLPQKQRTAVRADGVAAACRRESFSERVRWLGFRSDQLTKRPAGAERLGVIAGRLPLAPAHLARVELDVARTLGDVPADLHTVIVIDHSRSMSVDELEAQRAIVAAYVRAAPTSRVQLIGYARRASALLPSWMVASHAAPRIDREIRALAPRNGSHVDEALREAARWLARVGGTKRIVLFSDERLAKRFDQPANLLPEIPPGTLVHVVRPSTAGAGLVRDDAARLAVVAEETEGISVEGSLDDKDRVDATMLLRPTSIDRIEIGDSGWVTSETIHDERTCEESLREGHTCTWWGDGASSAGPLTVRARIWNKPLVRVVRPNPAQARSLARILSVADTLDTELQAEVDRIALAVNSVWSLFVTWGGKGGYEDVGGFGAVGTGRSGRSTIHRHGALAPIHRIHGPVELREQLAPALHACRAGDAPVRITVETTREEIVDVAIEASDGALRDCIAEAVWELTLRIADAPPRATTRVAFGNKP